MARDPNISGDISLLYSFILPIFVVLIILTNLNTFISHALVIETLTQRAAIIGEFNV